MLALAHDARCRTHPPSYSLAEALRTRESRRPILAYPFPEWPSFALARKSSCLRDAYELTARGSPGDGSHVSAIRAFGFTLCLIYHRRVGGFRVLIMASTQGAAERRETRKRKRERKRGKGVKKICGKKGKRAVPRASIMGV